MLNLPFKRKAGDAPAKFLTVDIGSNSVKVMAFEVGEIGAQITGFSTRELLPDSTRSGMIVDIDDVEQALTAAISDVTEGRLDITDTVFGVSGTLSVGLMTTVRATRGKNEPVSSKEISDILEKTNHAAYDQAQNIFLEITGDAEEEFQMITSSIVYTKLDDKEVKNPEGLSGQKLEIAVFTAFTPTHHLQNLEELADRVGLDTIAVGPTMYALTKSLSFAKGTDFDGVIMDIGGEVTDIGVVFGGGIVSTRSIEIGGAHFTKVLSREMSLSLRDAERKKIEYAFGRIPESDGILIKGYIDNLLDIWLDSVELIFQNFTGVKTFAPSIYLCGGAAELPDVYEVLTKEPWAKAIPFKSPPEFSKLSLQNFQRVLDRSGTAGGLDSIVPAALSIIYLEAMGLVN